MPLSQHEDWTLFRSLGTLGQQAGVSQDDLPDVVVKELVDNALDASATCHVDVVPPNGFVVEDDGPGMPGDTPGDIARLFSISRPLVSSKLTRLPTRGALGNGLRVVAGAVLASEGTLQVTTNGQVLRLIPQDDGTTRALLVGPDPRPGTRVEVQLGASLPVDDGTLKGARNACLVATGKDSTNATCKTSPHWYDADSFYELLQAADGRSAREVVAEFDGCSGAKAGHVCAPFLGRDASSLTRLEATALLVTAQQIARPVSPSRLGRIGAHPSLPRCYASATGEWDVAHSRGGVRARIPYVVEVWAAPPPATRPDPCYRVTCNLLVNKTPVTTFMSAHYYRTEKVITLSGCGLAHEDSIPARCLPSSLWINVQTPYMPITTEGKGPDLSLMIDTIAAAIETAVKKAKRLHSIAQPQQRPRSIKEITQGHIPTAVAVASSSGRYRFSQRQLFYVIRPLVAQETGQEPQYETFAKVLTAYEETHGPLHGLYRDPRGIVYHPHLGVEIPLGTLAVEEYERPAWTFNKVLYCEKEGFFSILRSEQWPERHDCALLTSKGQASRAAKDLIDHLGDTDEEVTFYCIHDADAAGTMIHQALQEATSTRGARRVLIVNLGLDPWEAVAMGLDEENVTYEKRQPVARYVEDYGRARDDDWADWLQTHRVELNAMTTANFLTWLDGKMATYAAGKVIPPPPVLLERLQEETRAALTERITARTLAEADLDGQIAAAEVALAADLMRGAGALPETVAQALQATPATAWGVPIKERATELCTSLEDDET